MSEDMKKQVISWNNKLKLILSDVDETIADVYVSAEKDLIIELISLLNKGVSIFFVTNGGLKSVCERITNFIPKKLKHKILISHCTGAEVWGFDKSGMLFNKPFYSLYEKSLNSTQRKKWREIIQKLIREFNLKTYNTMPVPIFRKKTHGDPLSIMYDDRGPQITFEVVNAYNLAPYVVKKLNIEIPLTHGAYDLRIPIARRADQLFIENKIHISSRVEAVFALNFAIKGISKETSVRYVLKNKEILKMIGLENINTRDYLSFEIWGDKFSEIGGPDKHMCMAVDKKVRAIDFRDEKPEDFPKGYNIVIWDGKKHLHEGLLEYLQSRRNQ